ncbi:MAG: MATE family efflux transporter [Ottowia sp.]|uniref:MATE family efflux transporter n=1 Tax=Ottowia sp. TaxID=1898956 RepID=UPI0039E436E4
MLDGPIVPTVFGLAWPNILMMLAQSSTGIVETGFIARLGTESLAGMALVVPLLMLMQNMSQGAMGGGISSTIARALGEGKRAEADDYVLHALVLNIALGAFFSIVMLIAAPWLYPLLGGHGQSLAVALTYSNIVFGGIVLMWIMNAFASAIRGTGNMLVPGLVICGGAALLIPLSAALIFGYGSIPRLGMVGAGIAMLAYYGAGSLILGWYCASGRNPARLRFCKLRYSLFYRIFSVGGLATINSLQTNVMIALSIAVVGSYAGTAAVAGYAVGSRLEYLIAPLAFGIGAPLVAMVSSNIGAQQPQRALRIAMAGGALAFVLAETIGLVVAIWPQVWLGLFSDDPDVLSVGAAYLRLVGPFYGFFGMGWALYFASQGARRLKWPLLAGLLRLVLSVGGGWLALRLTGSLDGFFAIAAFAMVLYGAIILTAIWSGTWFRTAPKTAPAMVVTGTCPAAAISADR